MTYRMVSTYKMDIINKILATNADKNIKECLCLVASEWECFKQLKAQYPNAGLLKACYREFGVKFLGMYGVNELPDLLKLAESNQTL